MSDGSFLVDLAFSEYQKSVSSNIDRYKCEEAVTRARAHRSSQVLTEPLSTGTRSATRMCLLHLLIESLLYDESIYQEKRVGRT